jgi:flagellar protein FliO/FliZ
MVTPSPRASFDLGPAPQPASTGSLLQTTLALLFVLALLIGLAWLLKRFGPKGLGGGGNTVRLVGALNVGARERILVVEVGDQWIVVGASPGRMNALSTMPRHHIDEAAVQNTTVPTANFAEWFKQTIEKRHGK